MSHSLIKKLQIRQQAIFTRATSGLPVLIQGTQRECLREKDFSVVRGQTVRAGSVYDCSKISTRAHSNFTN